MRILLSLTVLIGMLTGCSSNTSGDPASRTGTAAGQGAATEITGAPGAASPSMMPDAFALPPDLTTTPSGLKYAIDREGTGPQPVKGQTVRVHFTAWLENGTRFDSSRDTGKPIEFVVGEGQVIPGWDEGVAMMKVGERRILVIPPPLAYGNQGSTGVIPPNATLIFMLELVGIR